MSPNPPDLAGAAGNATVSALERGIALLRCFDDEHRTLAATELARRTGIPRPTVARLASTLAANGLLTLDAGGDRYRLGAGVVALARVFLAGLDIRAAARPPMQALAEQFGGSVYLAVRDGLEMVLIEACRPRRSMIAARLDVGSRAPLPNSALGRAYLAALEPAPREQLIESLRLARGSDWSRLEPGLNGAMADAHRLGYCLSVGEFHSEINSVSVPMLGPEGELMAFNCGGAAYAFPESRLRDELAPQLIATAQRIAHDIGGTLPCPAPSP